MPKSMKPGETITVRYWHASKAPPEGWRDVMPMGGHHWRGKIIQKVETINEGNQNVHTT